MHLWHLYFVFFAAIVLAAGNQTVKRIGTGGIPFDKQTYNFSPENRCALLSHQSAILKNGDHNILVIEGGMAKFKFIWNAEVVEVLDLNPYTISIDLTREFDLYTWTPGFQTRKPLNVPVLNRFGMWIDSTQNYIYIQGGHFYNAPKWNESSYSPDKENIPGWMLWRFDVRSGKRGWEDITGDYGWEVVRALAGAAVSIPELDLSFYGGGITNSRTSSETPLGVTRPQLGMLTYDHATATLTNDTFFGDEDGYGYWHGRMFHLPIGCGKGFLISFIPEKARAGTFIQDDAIDEKTGEAVLFNYAMIYDLDRREWLNQSTTFFDDEKPIARTRFCGAVVYSEETNTWDLWIHGGMRIDDESQGIDEMWVLSMPTFIWTKVSIPFGNSYLRGHTCHAVGEQLLIIGGYPPGRVVDEAAPCDNQLVKVFNMRNPGWKSRYELGTVYTTPQQVIINAGLNYTGNRSPRKGWADKNFGEAFESCPKIPSPVKPPSTDPEAPRGLSIGAKAAIGVVGGLVFLGILYVLYKFAPYGPQPRPRRPNQAGTAPVTTGQPVLT